MTESPDSPDQRAVESESAPRATQRRWKLRLVLSLFVGIVMTAVPLWSGWAIVRDTGPGPGGTKHLWLDLQILDRALNSFREKHQREPESLDELKGEFARDFIPTVDPWGRPYWIDRSDEVFYVGSHGRDGVPGGAGLDADRSTVSRHPAAARITLWQFLFELDAGGVWLAAALSGLLAAVIAWRDFPPERWTPWTGAGALLSLALWAFLAHFAGGAIAVLHLIPSGH